MTWTQFDVYDSSNPKDSSFIMFSKSTDQGVTWSEPKRISKYGGDCLDGDNTVEGAVPAFGKDNALVVTWTGPRGLMMQRSIDEGKTWLPEERKIIDHPGGWDIKVPGFIVQMVFRFGFRSIGRYSKWYALPELGRSRKWRKQHGYFSHFFNG